MFEFENSDIKKFYEGVEPIPVGQVLTFAQLGDVGFDVKHNRGLIYGANKYLLDNHNKMLISQRNVGYKMAEATEQLNHSKGRNVRAVRQIKKGLHEVNCLDVNGLTEDQRKTAMDLRIHYQTKLRALRKRVLIAESAAKKSVVAQGEVRGDLEKLLAENAAMLKRLAG